MKQKIIIFLANISLVIDRVELLLHFYTTLVLFFYTFKTSRWKKRARQFHLQTVCSTTDGQKYLRFFGCAMHTHIYKHEPHGSQSQTLIACAEIFQLPQNRFVLLPISNEISCSRNTVSLILNVKISRVELIVRFLYNLCNRTHQFGVLWMHLQRKLSRMDLDTRL